MPLAHPPRDHHIAPSPIERPLHHCPSLCLQVATRPDVPGTLAPTPSRAVPTLCHTLRPSPPPAPPALAHRSKTRDLCASTHPTIASLLSLCLQVALRPDVPGTRAPTPRRAVPPLCRTLRP